MNIIIDSNILFSALIKDSITRRIILEYDDHFLFPSYIFIEMKRHKKELLKKSKMKEKEFEKLLEIILKKVVIVPSEVLKPYSNEAADIVREIDPDDVLFVACGIAYHNSVIWSDDKALKKQDKVTVLDTQEIMDFLGMN